MTRARFFFSFSVEEMEDEIEKDDEKKMMMMI